MKKLFGLLAVMLVLSTTTFTAGFFNSILQKMESKEDIAERNAAIVSLALNSSAAEFNGSILTLNDLIDTLTDGVVIDNALQYGSIRTNVMIKHEKGETDIKKILQKVCLPGNIMGGLQDMNIGIINSTYELDRIYNRGDVRKFYRERYVSSAYICKVLKTLPFKNSYVKESVESADEQTRLNYALISRVTDLAVYIVPEKDDRYKGEVTFTNGLVAVTIPYVYDSVDEELHVMYEFDTLTFRLVDNPSKEYRVKPIVENIFNTKELILGMPFDHIISIDDMIPQDRETFEKIDMQQTINALNEFAENSRK